MQGYRIWKDTPPEQRKGKKFKDKYKNLHSMPNWARACALGKPQRATDFFNYMTDYCDFKTNFKPPQ